MLTSSTKTSPNPCGKRSENCGRKSTNFAMRYKGLTAVLIGLNVLCLTACSVSRKTATETRRQRTEVVTDTLREMVLVTVRDTVWEKTTETLLVNDTGDTLQRNIVTDRLTVRDRDRVHDQRMKISEVRDDVATVTNDEKTVVASDKVEIDANGNMTKKDTPFRSALKWIVALIVAVMGLIITIKMLR
jgi:hypothetical protein